MITSSPAMLTLALFVGLIAGGIFFAGLWFTVRQLAVARSPAALVVTSSMVRLAIVLGAFFLVGRGHIDRMLVCLLGLLLARFIVMRLTKPEPEKEAARAPKS